MENARGNLGCNVSPHQFWGFWHFNRQFKPFSSHNVFSPHPSIESWILVFEFKYSPRILQRLPTAPRFNNSIREEKTVIIGSHELLLAIVGEWKINWLSCVPRQPDWGTPFDRKQPEKQEGESIPGTHWCTEVAMSVCVHVCVCAFTIQEGEIPCRAFPTH